MNEQIRKSVFTYNYKKRGVFLIETRFPNKEY